MTKICCVQFSVHCKAEMQYLLTFKVLGYCFLALHGSTIIRRYSSFFFEVAMESTPKYLIFANLIHESLKSFQPSILLTVAEQTWAVFSCKLRYYIVGFGYILRLS